MRLLVDTHLLLWAALEPERLSIEARSLLADRLNEPLFSAASIWEASIKHAQGRADFRLPPQLLRRGLLDNGTAKFPLRVNMECWPELFPCFIETPSIAF